MMQLTTLTQGIFLCCLFVFGPFFGFWAAYRALGTRIGMVLGFIFASYCAYIGWFIAGVIAMLAHPNYPWDGLSEWVAALYVVPGFITGAFGVKLLDGIHRKHGGAR